MHPLIVFSHYSGGSRRSATFLCTHLASHGYVVAALDHSEAAWMPAAMRPAAELCTGEQAHVFVRGLTLSHLDAALRRLDAAGRFLAGDVEGELAARGVEAVAHRP